MYKFIEILKKNISTLFLIITVIYITCFILSNILAAKQLKVFNWSISAGVIVFPISYIINDIITEAYGLRKSKLVIYLGFAINIFMVLIFELSIVLPAPNWYENNDAFSTILGSTPRVVFAGLVAYLLGSLSNAFVMNKMKKKDKNDRKFCFRAILSTIAGETVDSLIFVTIAFLFVVPTNQIPIMIITQIIFKTLYECICLPITSIIVKKVKVFES